MEPVSASSALQGVIGIGEDIRVWYRFDKNFDVYFEDFKRGTGNITLSDGRGDTRKIAVNDRRQVSLAVSSPSQNCICDGETGSVLTINPLENLLPNSQYTLLVDPEAVTTFAGKPSSRMAKPIIIKTGSADTTPIEAKLDGIYPARTPPSILASFNKKIRADAGNITISNGEGDTQLIAANDKNQVKIEHYSKGGSVLTVRPSKPLLSGSRYFVLVDNGAFTDLSGNPFAGVQDPNAVTFTTAPPLRVEEINHGSRVGQYEDKDVLVFHFDAPVKDYHSFHLNNGHTFGGNDVLLSPDGLSASVELTATSTIAPGDVLTITLRDITDVQFKL